MPDVRIGNEVGWLNRTEFCNFLPTLVCGALADGYDDPGSVVRLVQVDGTISGSIRRTNFTPSLPIRRNGVGREHESRSHSERLPERTSSGNDAGFRAVLPELPRTVGEHRNR